MTTLLEMEASVKNELSHIPAKAKGSVNSNGAKCAIGTPSDETLVSRIANGDQAALRILFQRHFARIHRFALRFVNDAEAAHEIVNDTFLIVWRQAACFEGRSLVATWLLGIARYRALGAVKARRFTSESLDEHEATLVDPTERVDARMQREEQDGRLKACIAALPPEQGQLVEMHYFRDISLKDASAMTGLPLNTVKTRLFLARKKLARMLTREEDETPGVFSVAHIAPGYRVRMQSAH